MSGFSPDGQWWWDGAQWAPTTGIHLSLPQTEFERSGRLNAARRLVTIREWMFIGFYILPISVIGIVAIPIFVIAWWIVTTRVFRAYRQWTLEMLALATAQLLSPDEPMLAGEATAWQPLSFVPSVQRDLAISVTRAHVLLYSFDTYNSSTSWVIFAAHPTEVEILTIDGLLRRSLVVAYAGRRWFLRGSRGVFDGEPVLEAWRASRA